MLALFAMVAIQAQNLLIEGFENGIPSTWLTVDADNDGDVWDEIGMPGHNSDGCATSRSYDNNSGPLTPDNWLITPAVNLTANASLSFWVCAQDSSYAAEHYGVYISTTGTATSNFTLLFEETLDANGGARAQGAWKEKTVDLSAYTGQTVYIAFRHFNCTDQFYMNLDDVVIFAMPTSPTIIATPTAINFGTGVVGFNKNATVDVATYNLTAGVTATTTAPFSVSADGTTFATTATIASTGGTLSLRYTPTAVGTDNGTVVLSSTGANDDTVALTGSAIECTTTIPYSCNFGNANQNLCWEVVNANDDGYTFTINEEDSIVSYHWNSSSVADDWLISPAFNLTGAEFGYFDFASGSSYYTEKFQVFAIDANDNQTALTSVISVNSTAFDTQVLDLSSLIGNYRIGIHCVSDADQYYLYITNFEVNTTPPAASMTISTNALDFSTIAMGSTSNPKTVVMKTINVNEAFTLTTAAPFEISLDGTNYAATQTIPANATLVVFDTIYTRFAPTTTNTFSQNLTISSTTFNESVALTGAAEDCSGGIDVIPFTYDFNTGIYPPVCWGYNDAENYFRVGVDTAAGNYAIGVGDLDMLVTPEIHATTPMAVSFGYRNNIGGLGETPTSFRVGYSTTDDNASSFTWFTPVTITDYPADGTIFDTYTAEVPANTKHVAIDVTALGTYLYYGIFVFSDELYIDNFTLTDEATLLVNPESMAFGSVTMGSVSAPKTATINSALLASDIAVTAPANFEVSSNGASFASTATIPATGGTLYVRYNPSATGSHNGNITLVSGSLTKTIAVTGSAVDCSTPETLPFFEDFEEELSGCWTILDEDGDSYSWMNAEMTPYEGNGCISSASYINSTGALTPDNWLITPALTIPSEGAKLSFYVNAQDASYPAEHYGVYVSTTGTAPSNFTLLYEEDLDEDGGNRVQGEWKEKRVNLPYGNQTIYIAFRHFNVTDQFWMNIDNVNVTAGVGVENHEVSTKIYPNPANTVLNINANSNINRVEVYNMMGQMVGMYEANDVNTQINTSAFANGVYTVKISTENGTTTQKFTVAR